MHVNHRVKEKSENISSVSNTTSTAIDKQRHLWKKWNNMLW